MNFSIAWVVISWSFNFTHQKQESQKIRQFSSGGFSFQQELKQKLKVWPRFGLLDRCRPARDSCRNEGQISGLRHMTESVGKINEIQVRKNTFRFTKLRFTKTILDRRKQYYGTHAPTPTPISARRNSGSTQSMSKRSMEKDVYTRFEFLRIFCSHLRKTGTSKGL